MAGRCPRTRFSGARGGTGRAALPCRRMTSAAQERRPAGHRGPDNLGSFRLLLGAGGEEEEDTTPPQIDGCEDRTVPAQSAAGAVVEYEWITVTDDVDPDPTVEFDPPSGSELPLGDTPVTATATDASGNSSVGYFTVTVAKTDQTIAFPAIGNKRMASTVTLAATASSGLAATYEVASGPATIDDAIVTFTGIGEVSIMASQGGDDVWNPAPDVARTFTPMAAPRM